MQPRHLATALIVLAVLSTGAAGALCPLCRNALEAPEAAALAQGFREGILFLLVIPFGLVGVVAGLFLRQVDRTVTRDGLRTPKAPLRHE